MNAAILRVALDVPLRRLFDYLAPPGPAAIPAGVRVRVPFGRQKLVGLVIESVTHSQLPADKLKPVIELLERTPLLDAAALGLLRWAADYYHHPIGEVFAAALPKALRQGASAIERQVRWSATAQGREAQARGEPRRAPKQQALLRLLIAQAGASAELLNAALPGWRDAARQLQRRNWIACSEADASPAAGEPVVAALDGAPLLGAEQRCAVDAVLGQLGRFHAFVLHGITGSGKTEVYLHIVEQVLARGKAALVLVPEIGLTPQLVGRFRARFAVPLAVLHSGLTDTERLKAWRDAYAGAARIIIGTRSAVFAPACNLGVVIVDEEHDASFKQHEGGFRYSARDLAVLRGQRSDVPVVLGSATPALESLNNVAAGRYSLLTLPRRAAQAVPPHLRLIDLRNEPVHAGISRSVVTAMERHLAEGSQVLVFLNRRGYAPTLLCTACGWSAPCLACDARLTVHRGADRLRCHHCGAEAPLPQRCPQCGYAVKPVGQGTERVEETLAKRFAQVPLVRLDRDAVRRRGDMDEAMRRIASGEARILVGTQMVTKGHDFPNITLVVVLNADQGLFSTDFRASERLAQTIIQVAGRAGRGERAGEVLIQTEFPQHPLLVNLLSEGYEGFAREALRERHEAAWPPYSRLAVLRDTADTAEDAIAFLRQARSLADPPPSVMLRGPVPAAMARRAGRYHAQLLLESEDRAQLHRFIEGWLPALEQLPEARRVNWVLDVDPIELF